jgi:sugar phosphate permease
MYRTCAVVALLVTNAYSLDVRPTKGRHLKSGTTVAPITSKMTTMRSAHSHSRLPSSNTMRPILTSGSRVQMSSIPVDYSIDSMSPNREQAKRLARRNPTITNDTKTTITTTTTSAIEKKVDITKMDVCLFATYFFNIIAVTLSVVTVPALAADYFSTPQATAAFVAGVASMAPLGGGFGKIINGFVCQNLGGRRSSWLYLVALAFLSVGMSVTTSAAPIGLILMGYEFLSSIQWTSLCYVMSQHYQQQPELMARGIAIISLASTTGALSAKMFGAALLQATNWRIVTQFGAGSALLGALAMKIGVSDPRAKDTLESTSRIDAENQSTEKEEKGGGLVALKAILGNPLFWQIGLAHSLGYLARGNDRLLGSFLQEVSNLPRK